jgi:transcriptional regulator with XRE-family HTH domain
VPNLSKHRQAPALVSLGTAIRDARQALNISQETLALHSEVDRSYLGRVERGDNNVALLPLVRISAALGISVEELMRRAGL